ncbi:MAG: valine--tRNA ligase [Rhodospirillaceae bacterium]|nr:valine--tRNA ligase [Rhodospirillaceae bacterium]|tara:strand:- start:2655 stop:5312 length:2658 start_codon:yes stop_codon:yes gene_type:complete
MLDKTYRPGEVEEKHYASWESKGAFACGQHPDADPFAIVIPPPNITGSLHMGHALNSTLQDILIRYQRMRGLDALWQPGTDHAGIATQIVVERQLAEEGKTRHDLGRGKFIERVWEWKAESGGTITSQLRRLGASCDWGRERFTMDAGLSSAVRKVFVELYKQNLIYRDKRLVNWDPELHTAISDLEVEQREVTGKMWYFKYPIEDREGEFVTIATTRPETMLGDVAVAVHPDDGRYKDLVGRNCILPIVGRKLIVVADEYADPEKGSGAVKMTPAHDFNDFEVGKRHNLKMVNIFDQDARLNDNVPEAYRGMDRYEARVKVLAEMESLGLFDKVGENPMTIPYGDRSGVVIEPWLMDQWFVDAERLAGPAITAVEQGRTTFVPNQWQNTYYEWMRNIQPWCISRQIWWGHQIPAWFGPDGEIFVEETEEEALAEAEKAYGKPVELERDEDVLDTWFSSALWPFSTLGWPDETPELKRYYPTDVLITGFDIIFFWVARMMMMGLHFMDEVPFHAVYIHALVRDEKGQKMSKSKGNIIDPLKLIDKFGADALRFTLTALAAQGRDVRLSESRVEGYRNFVTKLWNAARFCQMNECTPVDGFDPSAARHTVNRWIIGKVRDAEAAMTGALQAYRFNDAAGALYHFTWGTFCDWYLEFTKPILEGDDEAAKAETRATAAWTLDQLLHLLHPIMPFVTEELWEQMADGGRDGPLITSAWPKLGKDLVDADANAEMDWVVRLISQVRAVRAEMNVPPKAKIPLKLKDAGDKAEARMGRHQDLIKRLARLSSLEELDGEVPKGAIQDVIDEATIILPIADVIDLDSEKTRLEKEIAKLNAEVERFEKKLANEKFIANAPEAVVETEREKLEDAINQRAKMDEALGRLTAAG